MPSTNDASIIASHGGGDMRGSSHLIEIAHIQAANSSPMTSVFEVTANHSCSAFHVNLATDEAEQRYREIKV